MLMPKSKPPAATNRIESAERQLLDALHRLPLERQRKIVQDVLKEAEGNDLSFNPLLSNQAFHKEARRLAKECGIALETFVKIIDPRIYQGDFKHGEWCTLARMIRTESAQVIVDIKAREDVMQKHLLLPSTGFALHVLFGPVTVAAAGHSEMVQKRKTIHVPEGHSEVIIYGGAGSWLRYEPHPLSAWVTEQKIGD